MSQTEYVLMIGVALSGKTNKLFTPIITEWDEFEKKLDKMKK